MKQAGAIIRVSTTKQLDGTSPEKQIENILAFASSQGYEIKSEHIWQNAESGSLRGEDREGFQQSLKASEMGDISRVYVFSLDRLGRDLIETLVYLRALTDRGADCWEAEHRQQLKHDDLVVMILGAVASNERKQIIARTQDGLLRSIAAGKYSGGIIAYGYELNPVTKMLEVNETEATVIRSIFQWCVEEHMSSYQIAERLNALSVPTHYAKDGRRVRKGKRGPESTLDVWRQGQVLRILKNRSYTGHWQYGKRSKKGRRELIDGYAPVIISEELFAQAAEVLASFRIAYPRNARHQYLLRGLIRCGICGLAFCGYHCRSSYQPKFKPPAPEIGYYACNGHRLWKRLKIQERCGNVYLRSDGIEEFVWQDVKQFCLQPDIALSQLRADHRPFNETITERLAEAEQRLAELKRQELNLLRIAAQSEEVDTKSLDQVMAENRQSQKVLNEYISRLQAERLRSRSLEHELEGVAERLKALSSRIENATFEEKRNAILALVKGIEVVPQEINGKRYPVVTITYRFNEPCPEVPELPGEIFVIPNHTPVPVDIMETRSSPAHAPWEPSSSIRNEFLVPFWIELTFTSRFHEWIMKN